MGKKYKYSVNIFLSIPYTYEEIFTLNKIDTIAMIHILCSKLTVPIGYKIIYVSDNNK